MPEPIDLPGTRIVTTVPYGHAIEVPYPCPYCGAALTYTAEAWEQTDDGSWIASSPMPQCQAMPDMGTEAWDDWELSHYYEPYIHQMPVDIQATAWINANYRFLMD